jgi:thiol-disulfide isomerase/thioredoxin
MKSFFHLLKLKQQGKYSEKVNLPRYKDKQGLMTFAVQGRSVRMKNNMIRIGLTKEMRELYNLNQRYVEFTIPKELAEEGTGIHFETTDLDGNSIDSSDLFAGHTITMVNLWATWCGPCINELPELEKLNQEFLKKNCQIIGIVTDTNKEEKITKAKEILAEKGVTYTNLASFDGLSGLLPQFRSCLLRRLQTRMRLYGLTAGRFLKKVVHFPIRILRTVASGRSIWKRLPR